MSTETVRTDTASVPAGGKFPPRDPARELAQDKMEQQVNADLRLRSIDRLIHDATVQLKLVEQDLNGDAQLKYEAELARWNKFGEYAREIIPPPVSPALGKLGMRRSELKLRLTVLRNVQEDQARKSAEGWEQAEAEGKIDQGVALLASFRREQALVSAAAERVRCQAWFALSAEERRYLAEFRAEEAAAAAEVELAAEAERFQQWKANLGFDEPTSAPAPAAAPTPANGMRKGLPPVRPTLGA